MQDLWGLINSSIFILVISAVAGYIKGYVDKYSKTSARKEATFNELVKTNKELLKQNEDNARRIEEISKVIQNITNGSKVLLRDRIIQSCRVFIERGHINHVAKNNIAEMYHWYHDELGGNGLGELYYQKMMELPVMDEDVPFVSSLHLGKEMAKGGDGK